MGSELISQIARLPKSADRFRLVFVSSSSRSLLKVSPSGIDLSSWKESLASSTAKPDLKGLPAALAPLVASGSKVVVVDNSSSDDVAALYPSFLAAGISVVTPNKKAYSSSLDLYQQILSASQASGAKFLNESTVGAGLPIISTLKDLVDTGDKVRVGYATRVDNHIHLNTMITGS